MKLMLQFDDFENLNEEQDSSKNNIHVVFLGKNNDNMDGISVKNSSFIF